MIDAPHRAPPCGPQLWCVSITGVKQEISLVNQNRCGRTCRASKTAWSTQSSKGGQCLGAGICMAFTPYFGRYWVAFSEDQFIGAIWVGLCVHSCSRRLPDIHWSRTNSCLGNMSPGKCAAGNPRTKPLHANHWLASKKQPASERDDLHPLKFDQAWRHNWSRRYHFSKPYNSGMLKFGSIYFTPNSVFPNYSYDFPLMWGCEQFQNEGRRLGIVGSHGGVLGGLGSNTDGGQGGLGGIVAGFFKRFFFRDRLWWRMVKRLPQASASEEYKGPFQLDFGGCFSLVSRKKSGINSWGVKFFRADS